MKTLIFENAKRRSQTGLTLLEILITLSLVTLLVASFAGLFVQTSPRIAVKSAADQLVVDLKRARFEMTKTGETIAISFDENGYFVDSMNIDQKWPKGVAATLVSSQEDQIIFAHQAQLAGYEITIFKGGLDAQISIAPITGRIAQQ